MRLLLILLVSFYSFSMINIDDFDIELKLKIKDKLGEKISDFKIKEFRIPEIKDVKSVKEVKKIEFLNKNLIGSVAVKIKTEKRKYFGSIVIARKIKNLFAKRKIKRGEIFTKDDFEVVETYQTVKNFSDFVSSYDEIKGKTAKLDLKPYKKLYKHQFEYPYIVKKGDVVIIRAKKGKLTVSIKGTATQNGKKGKYITVKSDYNNKILRAKVITPKSVELFVGD